MNKLVASIVGVIYKPILNLLSVFIENQVFYYLLSCSIITITVMDFRFPIAKGKVILVTMIFTNDLWPSELSFYKNMDRYQRRL